MTSSHPSAEAIEAAAMLPLPAPEDMSESQVRGAACVWCAVTLSTSAAIDLGERRINLLGSSVSWFPRGCHPCTAEQVYPVLLNHGQSCEQCVDDAPQCEIGSTLWRLVREARR
jgi:hypothetical protein